MKAKLLNNHNEMTLGRSESIVFLDDDTLGSMLQRAEKRIYEIAIKRCKGNQSAAARALGVSRATLRTRLKEYFGDKYFRDAV